MKTLKSKKILLIAVLLSAGLCLTGCDGTPVIDDPEYTEQTARAIDGLGWKIYMALVLAAFMRCLFNK